MKKLFISLAMVFGLTSSAFAQTELGVFNHVSAGVGVGILTGGTIELAAPITKYVAVRAGYNFIPNLKLKTDLELPLDEVPKGYTLNVPDEVEVEGKLSMSTGHLLFDIYPFGTGLHLTAGAYFGSEKLVSVYNTQDGILQDVYDYNHRRGNYAPVPDSYGMIGLELGDYLVEPDQDGNAEASIKVNSFRPYLGIGFGRAVPAKHRLAVTFDMGVQFWGSPGVYVQDKKLDKSDIEGDGGDALKTLSKITVCPVLSLKLVGRIF